MKIEIWSDIMCPFCYIGKRNLEQAIAQLPFSNQLELEWKSYQLDPDLSSSTPPLSMANYLGQRKGMSSTQVEQMLEHLTSTGKQAGIDFQMQKTIASNTFLAHRLIHWAQKQGKGQAMEEVLFRAHFTNGKDINQIPVLTELAQEAGLNSEDAKVYLQSDQGVQEVQNDLALAQYMQIQGVPFFVVDQKYSISGAQPVEVLAQALTQAFQEQLTTLTPKNSGLSCGIDGCD